MNTKTLFCTRWAWWAGYSCQANMQMRDNSLPCYGLSLNSQSYCSLQLGYLHNQLSDLAILCFPHLFLFFSLQLALCPIQHLVYAQLLYVWMHVYLRYCAAWRGLIKSRDGAMVHFHNSLQLKATGHCSLFLPCFYKETCLRILNVFTEQALVCVTGSFRDVKHQLTNIYHFEKYYLIKTNGNNVDTKTAVCENKHVS